MSNREFLTEGVGDSAKTAFTMAWKSAAYTHGLGGFTGSLVEKTDFIMIDLPEGISPHTYAQQLIDEGDERIQDKFGPAGCIDLGNQTYLFFGFADA